MRNKPVCASFFDKALITNKKDSYFPDFHNICLFYKNIVTIMICWLHRVPDDADHEISSPGHRSVLNSDQIGGDILEKVFPAASRCQLMVVGDVILWPHVLEGDEGGAGLKPAFEAGDLGFDSR